MQGKRAVGEDTAARPTREIAADRAVPDRYVVDRGHAAAVVAGLVAADGGALDDQRVAAVDAARGVGGAIGRDSAVADRHGAAVVLDTPAHEGRDVVADYAALHRQASRVVDASAAPAGAGAAEGSAVAG